MLRWWINKMGNGDYMDEEIVAAVAFLPVLVIASIVAIIASVY